MEKNLSSEMRALVEECKKIYTSMLCRYSVSSMMGEDYSAECVYAIRLLSRASDLCVDMFEKQERIMDKMDKVMDLYIEQVEKNKE